MNDLFITLTCFVCVNEKSNKNDYMISKNDH